MIKQRRGFTLIELLVVVAIIALLISILLPSLSRARKQTRTAKCMANMKGVGLGLAIYLQEEREFYPGHRGWWEGSDQPISTFYPRLRAKIHPAGGKPHVSESQAPRDWDPFGDAVYTPGEKLFWCPEEDPVYWWKPRYHLRNFRRNKHAPFGYALGEEPIESTGDSLYGLCYGMPDWGSAEARFKSQYGEANSTYAGTERRLIDVERPDEFFCIMDSRGDKTYDDVVDPWDGFQTTLEEPSQRHLGFTVVLFADSHVEKMRWLDIVPEDRDNGWAADRSEDWKARRWNYDWKAHYR